MFKKIIVSTLVVSFMLAAVFVINPLTTAESAVAASGWSGTFTGSEPTYIAEGCSAFDPDSYQTFSFVPSVSGDYYYNNLSLIQTNGFSNMINLYENTFDPTNPATNHIGDGFTDETFTLNAGTTYIGVVSQFCGGTPPVGGFWSVAFSGPGSVNGPDPVFNAEGVFDGTESTFDSPYCGAGTPYDVVGPYTPTVTGEYGYGDVSVEYDVDMVLEIYMTNFDPTDPLTNYVESLNGDHDDYTAFVLTAGVEYYFVAMPISCPTPDLGAWEFVLGGPGVIIVPGSDAPGVSVPNFGEVMITSEISQFGYGAPAGEPARTASGAGVWLPHDWDGNGFDTYTVTGSTVVDGETWLSIFIGNETWVWVPQSTVITIR